MTKIKFSVVSIFLFFVFSFGANADTLGQNQLFFISPQYDAQSNTRVAASLRYLSDHAYFYIADSYWNNANSVLRDQVLDQIQALAQEFDKRIYPTEVQFFGSEPNPGVDGDPRVTILLTPLIQNAGGYFDTTNEYPATEVLNSNQREMIYLNVGELANKIKMYPFLAHEFQHLISFNQKEKLRDISDDIWLNELRSEYATTLLGYNEVYDGSHLQRRTHALLNDPSDGLTEWKNLPSDYGQVGLFGEYIAEHWSPQVISGTIKNNLVGIGSLTESLAGQGFGGTFLDVFRDWLIANFLNDSSVDPKFIYLRTSLADLRVASTRTISNLDENVVFAVSDPIKDWQGRWYDVSQLQSGTKNILKATFNSPSLTSFYISYLVFRPDGKYQTHAFSPVPGSNVFYLPGIGTDVSRIVVMPIKKDKIGGFSSDETPVQLTFTVERVASASAMPVLVSIPASVPAPPELRTTNYELQTTGFPDGSLVRARGDYKVYVIKGGWRRHIINPLIFKFYPGLGFEKVQEVDPSILAKYQESNLIRSAGGGRVYSFDDSGLKHWLNMSGERFSASGRSWDSIFTVNLKELNFYKIGSSITK